MHKKNDVSCFADYTCQPSAQAQMRAKLAKFKANKGFAKRPAKQVKAAQPQVANALQKAVVKQ
jgi:hypothetical protein